MGPSSLRFHSPTGECGSACPRRRLARCLRPYGEHVFPCFQEHVWCRPSSVPCCHCSIANNTTKVHFQADVVWRGWRQTFACWRLCWFPRMPQTLVSRVTFLLLITGRKLKQSVIVFSSYYPQTAAFRYVGAKHKYSQGTSLLTENDVARSSL